MMVLTHLASLVLIPSPEFLQDWVLTEEEALPILKEAWDRGINTIDTANVYSYGVSERIIGQFIKKVRNRRFQSAHSDSIFSTLFLGLKLSS